MIRYAFHTGLLLLLIACGDDDASTTTGGDSTSTVLNTNQEVLPTERPAKEVEGIRVSQTEFQIPVETVGTVKATNKGKITAEASGLFQFDYIFEGKEFKKGEIIGRIEDYAFTSNLEKQEASFKRTYITFLENDVISKDFYNLKPMDLLRKLESTSNQSIVGRARTTGIFEELLTLKAAYIEQAKRVVRAPDNLVITQVFVENGQNVGKGTALFDYLYDKDKVIEISLFENECAYLKTGYKAIIKRQAVVTSDEYLAEVIGISRQISADRFRKVTLKFTTDNNLVDGEQVSVTLRINTGRFGIEVPNEAIVYRDQRPVVFVVENGVALWKYVSVGERFGDKIEIKSGIRDGDQIITKGHFTLAHQATVDFKLTRN